MQTKEFDFLEDLKNQSDDFLLSEVIDIIISEAEDYDNLSLFFEDLNRGGCADGMIGSLLYYEETEQFAKKHLVQIMEILDEIKEDTREEFSNYRTGQRLNDLAWLAFEIKSKEIEDLFIIFQEKEDNRKGKNL